MPYARAPLSLAACLPCLLAAVLACSASAPDKAQAPAGGSSSSGSGGSASSGGGASGGTHAATAAGASGASGASAAGGLTGGTAGTSGAGELTGGSAGTAAAAGTAGAATKSGCAEADILCLTFDDLAAGSLPQGAPFQPYNCAGQATSTDLLVEAGAGVNGSKALTTQKSLNGGCNLLADLGEHAELWLTAHVKFSPGVPVATVHELTPFELTKTISDDPGIRPGIRADGSCNSWQGAELNITGGGERTGCTAFKFATGEWYCLEVQVRNQATSVEGNLYIDGAQQSYHIHQDAAASVVNMDWTGARMLRLGARSYSSNVESPVYVDNLSVSTQRVGCSEP